MRNPYVSLQVHPCADLQVIKAAHRTLQAKHGHDRSLSQELDRALALLSDPDERMKYDELLRPTVGSSVGSYRIIREIAEGGFGTTYEAEHLITGGKACIKHCLKVSDEYNEILVKEASILEGLAHFSLPAMRDVIRMEDGSLALVMAYVPGLTIEQVVKKAGKLDPEEAVAWIVERTGNALLYLHIQGVVHGDLKPQNVILQHERHYAFLIDFGLSASKPKAGDKACGYTEHFSPPEQVSSAHGRAVRPLLPSADLYSLGMLMLYMLGGGMEGVKRRQTPITVPAPMRHFIDSLIDPDPLKRPDYRTVFEQFKQVRIDSFGHARSGMKPIPGL